MLLKLIALCFLFVNFQSLANDDLQFSAFGTIGIVATDSERYGYRKDISYDEGAFVDDIDLLNHSLLGVQLDASFSKDFDFVGQAVLRDLSETDLDRYLTLAFLRYTPSVNWQIRLGRTAPDLFLITEYRDVDFATTWVTAPNEVYGIIPFRSVDGVDITYLAHLENGTLRAKIFTGSADSLLTSNSSILPIEVDDIIGFSLSYEQFDWSIQAQHSRVEIANESNENQQVIEAVASMPPYIWPNAMGFIDEIALDGKHASYSSVSGQKYFGNYLLTAELAKVASNDSNVIPDLVSGYVSLAYQQDEHTFYSVYAFTHSDNYHFDQSEVQTQFIPELVNAVEDGFNFFISNQQTFSLGWRWDLNANIATSVQWNNTHIDRDGSSLWINNSKDDSAETVNVLMFSLSFSL